LIDTPAAVVDLDRLERNLRRWQSYADEAGLRNRPHIKTHRSVEIARRQVALGAVGITCQKLGEAEVMVDGGIDDVLIPFNILGESKLERLRALARRTRVSVTVDAEQLLAGLAGADVGVLVECDTGLGRAGVQTPDDAIALAHAIERTDGVRFEGFLTFPAPPGAPAFLGAAVEGVGLEVPSVTAGGTPTMWSAHELRPLVTEYRVGVYAFHDRNSVAAGAATLDDVALTVHATVVSRPTPGRAILDAGSKVLSSDPGPDDVFGEILEAPASRIVRLNEEHAYVEVGEGDELELGRRVRIVPNHACVVSNLFDELLVERDGEIVDAWRVAARGRSR
jgi:D-serine deaminase-like pyridoxal phosphate-dependent protein